MTIFQTMGTSNMPQEAADNRVGIAMTLEKCCLQLFGGISFRCGNTST